MGGSPSTSRRSAKIPWSLTRRLSIGTRTRQESPTSSTWSCSGDAFCITGSLSYNRGEARKPWPQGALGRKVGVGVGDKQKRVTKLGTSAGRPSWGLSPQSSCDPESLVARSHRMRERCSAARLPLPFRSPILFPPWGPPRSGHTRTEGWQPDFRKSQARLCPHGDFARRRCRPGHCGVGLQLSLAALLSGSVTIRWRPWAGSGCRWLCAPTALAEEGWTENPPLTQLMVGPLSSAQPGVWRDLSVLS